MRRVATGLEEQPQAEHAADARVRAHLHVAAHHLRQAFADRQPEAGATESAGGGRVRLRERLEQPAQPLARDADAGVDHVDHHRHHVVVALGTGMHRDRTDMGELHGVRHQVRHDLPDPHPVAANHPGGHLVELEVERDPLGECERAVQTSDVVELGRKVDVTDLELELVRLHLREVEDVVDDHEQRVSAGADRGHLLALLLVEGRGGQQLGHAQHADQRCADLVAHHRQEVALGPPRILGPVERLRELAGADDHLLLERAGEGAQRLVGLVQLEALHLEHPLRLHASLALARDATLQPGDAFERAVEAEGLGHRIATPASA